MTVHVALLRAINVGGHQPVAMSDLLDLLAQLGFTGAQSLLQSGNLVFSGAKAGGAKLEKLLETEALKRLKLETDFFVRTAEQWQEVIAGNAFRKEAVRDPSRLAVLFFKDAPEPENVKALRGAITGPELIRTEGSHAYVYYPNGMGRSRLTSTLIEKKLATRGTARNWNTVRKLGALVTA